MRLRFWYFSFPTWQEWKNPKLREFWGCGRFTNLPHIIPGRWGWYWYGFEFGSRNPGDPVGVWLKKYKWWPW